MSKTLAEQIAEYMELDEALTGVRAFYATETDKESVEEAKEMDDEALLADALAAAKQNYDPETKEFVGESITNSLPDRLHNSVSITESADRARLRDELRAAKDWAGLKMCPPLSCDVDGEAREGISNYWAGDRIMDESSPELCGYSFLKDDVVEDEDGDPILQTRELTEGFIEEDEYTPKLNDKQWTMERFQYYAWKRERNFLKLIEQAKMAVLVRDGKELHRLNGVLFELRDSSFESRLLRTAYESRCKREGIKLPNWKLVNAASKRIMFLECELTKKVFEASRMLTAEHVKEGLAWFKQAWLNFKRGSNQYPELPPRSVEAGANENKPQPIKLSVFDLIQIYYEAKLDEYRDLWKLADMLTSDLTKPAPVGAQLLKVICEDKGVEIKRLLKSA